MNHNFWYRLADRALKLRIPVIAVFVVATAMLAGPVAENLDKNDNSLSVWFHEDDPDYNRYERFKQEFESDDMVMIVVKAPGEGEVFTPRMLELIRAIGEDLKQVVNIERVESIVTQNIVRGEGSDEERAVIIEPAVDFEDGLTEAELARAREQILGEDTFRGYLISEDAKVAVIGGRLVSTEDDAIRSQVVRDTEEVFAKYERTNPDVTMYLTGPPVIDLEFNRMAISDGETFLPLTLGFVTVVLFLLFRRPLISLLPVVLMAAVIIYVWGAYFVQGHVMNMVFQMSGSILIAACVADAVHILGHYYGTVHADIDKNEAIRRTVAEMARPCLFTSVTTAAGFFSFAASGVEPIEQLGLYSGLGCLLAFVATVLFIPAILSFLPMPSATKGKRYREGYISRGLHWIGDHVLNHRATILVVSGVLFVLAAFGLTKVRVEGNTIEYIPKDAPARQAIDFVQENMGGLAGFEVVFEGEPDLAKDPEFLRGLDRMQDNISKDWRVSTSFSHVDYLKDMNEVLTTEEAVPDTAAAVAQYLLLAEMSGDNDIGRFVNYDYSTARVTARASVLISQHYQEMVEIAEAEINEVKPEGVEAYLTGLVPLYAKFDHMILMSQIKSVLLAFVIIFISMSVLMKSVKIGALSMIPNGLPIFLTLSLIGYLDLTLDAATVMIAGIALGIAVDDTVHYLSRFRLELERADWDYELASHRATKIVGRPIVYTSIILMAGFGVLMLGSFRPTILFGALTSLTMLLALVGDLILLPALLLKLKPWGERPSADAPPVPDGFEEMDVEETPAGDETLRRPA